MAIYMPGTIVPDYFYTVPGLTWPMWPIIFPSPKGFFVQWLGEISQVVLIKKSKCENLPDRRTGEDR